MSATPKDIQTEGGDEPSTTTALPSSPNQRLRWGVSEGKAEPLPPTEQVILHLWS